VAAAALTHALWNRRLHLITDRLATLTVANFAIGFVLLPAALLWPPWSVWPLIGLSGTVQAVYALCLAAAYRRGALFIAYPLGRGIAPLLVALGGWVVLGHGPDRLVIFGTVALACGIALVATTGWRAGQAGAVGFALLTGLGVAGYSLIDAQAVHQVAAPGYFGCACLVAGTLMVGVLRGDWLRLRAALGPGLRLAVGIGTAYLLVLLAFQYAETARVAALRESSILLAVWLSANRVGWQIWLGSALVVLGIILAAVG
jgi:drug/metabolite transporter (DMT)-like permease